MAVFTSMYYRTIQHNILEALKDSPVVLLNGARQTGKSTLAQALGQDMRYLTLDDPTVLAAAKSDPFGFIAAFNEPICLDEVQRAPELFLAIKTEVDKNRTPGRFLLTGSANVLMLPQMADSLAGRMEIIQLWPLSQSELNNQSNSLIDTLFEGDFAHSYAFERADFITRLTTGGYPEASKRRTERRREAWFDNYLATILQRDVKDLAQIEGLTELPKLLELLAIRSGGLLNFAELSRSAGIAQTTLKRYMALLETLFLVRQVPAWASNLGKRLQKSPKLFLSDYGLMAHLQGLSAAQLNVAHGLPGDLVEAFVHAELAKHQTWAQSYTKLMHYRTTTGVEVDFVLENRRKELLGIEVKAAATVVSKDFNGLRHLRDTAPELFKYGVLLYTGEQVVAFDKQLIAVPIGFFLG
ncbi:ATPase [Candidatus Nitrosoglobus terrae]|uniref:ATPase n=1 Tax=Candidatus Nitrosoglobus terrae TaxID=1630141 RepID=A0A1Q2SPP9_9GAMM|nr:ATP-binding protein [Candidatus Nitrosoglobus terrae]BAW81069.1 ATPase [Candidatus Nitrosoglobus terrae]